MKLVPTLETRNRDAGLMDFGGKRPLETEADFIAAAARPGEVTRNEMARVKDDRCTRFPECLLCTVSSDVWFLSCRASWAEMMAIHGVEWDPDIRL